MGADQEIEFARRKAREDLGAFLAALAAGQEGNADAGLLGEGSNGGEVLADKNFGRRRSGRRAR